jgi:hypothetical protein
MAEKKENRDYPLATTSVTILDDLQKASVARLKAKREARKTNTKEGKGTQTGADKLQGLASLKNTLGKQYYRPTTETLAKRVKKNN